MRRFTETMRLAAFGVSLLCAGCARTPLPFCGDGYTSGSEQCDDGNAENGDGCDASCQREGAPICGDGVTSAGEECDDENTVALDGCDALCQLEEPGTCGNGLREFQEDCDDDNLQWGDGCDGLCQLEGPAVCGNFILEIGEECEDGNALNLDGCDAGCRFEVPNASCGNNQIDPAEECDDGNQVASDGCNATCQLEDLELCGDGLIEAGEQCDDGAITPGDGCSSTCQWEPAECGDGQLVFPEQCDDANQVSDDGCSSLCEVETPFGCGDGTVQQLEQCDDANQVSGDGCSSLCQLETPLTCGNGNIDPEEQCDDGNLQAGDGCNHLCRTELCEVDLALGALPLNIAVSRTVAVASAEDRMSGCGMGPERLISFELPISANLELSFLQAGDHAFALYSDVGGVCTSALAACFDPEGQASGGASFEGLLPGRYLLAVESAALESGGSATVVLTAVTTLPGCGNDQLEEPEVCDDGNTLSEDGCSADCLSDESCGNGTLDPQKGELCDDGNEVAGDGCSAECSSDETCGNSVTDAVKSEICDDGNLRAGDGCSSDCLSDETCGNSILDEAAGEECDDGGLAPGDGCDVECRNEPGICSVDEVLGVLTPGVIESRTLDISSATDDWLTDCGQPGPEHVMTLELERTGDIELSVCSTGSHAVGLYRSGTVTDVCVAQTGSCIGPVQSGCGLLTFGNRQAGLYYILVEANGAQQAGQVDLNLQVIGCDPDDDVELLPPGITTNFSFTTTTSRAQYDAGCSGSPSGGEWVLAFQLAQQANLQIDWTQTGDHVFALYNEAGGGCDNALVSCEDPLGQAAGNTIIPRLAAGAYFLVIDSFEPGQEGDLTMGLTPL